MAKFNSSNPPRSGESGFSLIETMIATMLLATALVGTAELMVISIRGNTAAQRSTFTSTLAQDKLEQLRGLAWGYDELGLPINDYTTNLGVNPPTDDGVGLSPSPSDALAANMTGYVDYMDRTGTVLGGGPTPLAGTVYVRRWSVEPLPTNPNNTLVIQVMVFSAGDRADAGAGVVHDRARDEARLVTVKTRKSR